MTGRLTIAYLDTCVVSGLARNDFASAEREAMIELLRRYEVRSVDFVTSAVALSELEQIPSEHQTPHLAVYHLLRKVRVLSEPSFTRLGPSGLPMANPYHLTWSRIHAILPDDNDAKHVFQASQHRVDYFVTVDESTILKHKSALAVQAGIRAVKPSELLALL
jgi:hypothetical protein